MTEQESPLVRYQEYSAEDFERDAAKARAISGTSFMELVVGENVVRFLPSKTAGISPVRSTGMHFVDAVPGLDQTMGFACPQKELGQPCPVCKAVEELRRSHNPVDRARGDKIAVKLSLYANVVDRAAAPDDPQHGLRVLRFGKMVLEQLKTLRRNTRVGGDFFNPGPKGFDVIIMKEGEQLKTKYKVLADRNLTPLAADPGMTQALIDNQFDLEAYVNPVVPEEIILALQSTRAAYGLPTGGSQQQARSRGELPTGQASGWPTRPATASAEPQAAPVGASLFAPAPQANAPTRSAVADADFSDASFLDEET